MTKLAKEDKEAIVEQLKIYFQEELDREIGGLEAEFLLDFFLSEAGGYVYNQALKDAQAVIAKHMDTVTDKIYELEKPTRKR
ncbi:MAG: DUF2164 domain-containing protein [Deferribacteres bacterium]|nr:DUF2164 domain-containing protein [candidate division KSB1 bacterium]MCB9500690.1 DUF2164 domain-containing protein [Deferribacteres bacterium]